MPSPQDFDYPLLNATLNGISFLFLVSGWLLIRSGRKKAHVACMVSALITSTAFLVSYLTYHSLTDGVMTKFPAEYPAARKLYLVILFSHIPLAGLLVPLVIFTVIPAVRARFDKHRKLARFTLPVWLYVSVTGVLIYLMLYRWYLPTDKSEAMAAGPGEGAGAAVSSQSTGKSTDEVRLSFEPELFKIHAKAEDDVVTARYEVTNHGGKAVRIVELDTTCYCLEVRSSADEIAPGATVIVEADFTLEKLVGETQKSVIIHTDNPSYPRIELAVQVAVDPIYEIQPLTLDWKVGEAAEPKEIVFKVVRDKPIHITAHQATRQQSFASEVKEIEAGREYRIVLTPKTTEKELLGFVRVITDCEIEKYATELMYFKISRKHEEGDE